MCDVDVDEGRGVLEQAWGDVMASSGVRVALSQRESEPAS